MDGCSGQKLNQPKLRTVEGSIRPEAKISQYCAQWTQIPHTGTVVTDTQYAAQWSVGTWLSSDTNGEFIISKSIQHGKI